MRAAFVCACGGSVFVDGGSSGGGARTPSGKSGMWTARTTSICG
jgi:hypothetical protein